MELLIPGLVFTAVALAVTALLPARSTDIQARLSAYQYSGPLTERDAALEMPLLQRLGLPLLHKLAELPARLMPQRAYEEARLLMVRANLNMDLNLFMGLRAAGLVIVPLLFVLLMGVPSNILMLGMMVLLGWFGNRLPVNWLRKKSAARQQKIIRSLPDTLDLI